VTGSTRRHPETLRVVIAGAGVAGLEAALTLRDLADGLVEVELLSPATQFVYRPMLVAEPFGTATALRLDLEAIAGEAGAHHRCDALASVDPGAGAVTTTAGAEVPYDALLIALGAQPVVAVPGALTFGVDRAGAEMESVLRGLGGRSLRRLVYVVPPTPSWTLAAYELALLTAAERAARRLPGPELTLVTAESEPLEQFGFAASRMVRETLERAGIELRAGARAERFADERLDLAGGEWIAADQVVSLPALTVPELPGLPQRRNGFVGTDVAMQVDGLERVWAAGDVTHFPIKNGGIAAQQADVAAQRIAIRAGAKALAPPFRPILRGALITGGAPELFEAKIDERGAGVAGVSTPLWSPSMKLAAPRLTPLLARALGAEDPAHDLLDLPVPPDADEGGPGNEQAVALLVAAADGDAARDDYAGALRWLRLVEQLDLALPAQYVSRRERWRHQLDPDSPTHPAAGRLDPDYASPAEARSELRRREGGLRESELRGGREMSAGLAALGDRIEAVRRSSRRSRLTGD
jgi:sulfide:quinone oxidoreductase